MEARSHFFFTLSMPHGWPLPNTAKGGKPAGLFPYILFYSIHLPMAQLDAPSFFQPASTGLWADDSVACCKENIRQASLPSRFNSFDFIQAPFFKTRKAPPNHGS